VGDFDLVPAALRRNDVRLRFEKIAVKPGKPTVFGVGERGYCFGLPGNPVSTFVVFELLVRPFLYRLMGQTTGPGTYRCAWTKPLPERTVRGKAGFP
jgi:molybdopterin molybdotransferase